MTKGKRALHLGEVTLAVETSETIGRAGTLKIKKGAKNEEGEKNVGKWGGFGTNKRSEGPTGDNPPNK